MGDWELRSGPTVGIGDGTLLIGWPCRRVGVDPEDRFHLVPVVVRPDSTRPGAMWVTVMDNTGHVGHVELGELQFDPKWKPPY
jgi:hypothetical protein